MRTVEWVDNAVRMIDQRHIPWDLRYVDLHDVEQVAAAIRDMVVRGAPAIGATAAFGMALAAHTSGASTLPPLRADLQRAGDILKASRPTAVNLQWAVDGLLHLAEHTSSGSVDELRQRLLQAAQQIADDDIAINRRMGAHGAVLIQDGDTVLHHCNTGALATVDHGTALGVIRTAFEQGKRFSVLLDETRPRLQGARLSAWELEQLGVPYHIIADGAAGYFMRRGEVNLVLVGADRIAANGDFANKIGTYQVAVLARTHDIPFYTVAPTSTIDATIPDGSFIPIEERDPAEVLAPYGCAIAPAHYKVCNPAFDVTPAEYVSGIVTEYGIVHPPLTHSIARTLAAANSTP
jgi:methylthioribose-1-phosphate isomerase